MAFKVFRWTLFLALLLFLVGLFRHTPALRELLRPALTSDAGRWLSRHASVVAGKASPTVPASAGNANRSGRLRKCVLGAEVIYTNEACPPGSRAVDVSGGSVTVLPAIALPVPATSAATPGLLPELAGKPLGKSVTEQQLDQIR